MGEGSSALPAGTRTARPRRRRLRPTADVVLDVAGLTALALLAPPLGATAWSLAFAAITVIALAARGHYSARLPDPSRGMVRAAVSVPAIAMMLTLVLEATLDDRVVLAGDAATHWLGAIAILAAIRLGLGATDGWRWRARKGMRRVLIVGAGEIGRVAARRLEDRPDIGLTPVGFVDDDPRDGDPDDPPVLGACGDLERIVTEHGIDTVLIGFSSSQHPVLLEAVHRSWRIGVEVIVIPRLFEVEGTRTEVTRVGGLPFVALHPSVADGRARQAKYAFERGLAALMLVAVAPILALTALAVRIGTGGPVLYRAARVGERGRIFEMYKLRTLAGSPASRGEADDDWLNAVLRVSGARWQRLNLMPAPTSEENLSTPVGRFLRRTGLDELPQLWNVVRGDMALVGPRPERVAVSEQFSATIYRYDDRYRVRPGITGWAQIQGLRGRTSLHDRVEWDNFYIENWSFWLDLKILVLTPLAMIRAGGT